MMWYLQAFMFLTILQCAFTRTLKSDKSVIEYTAEEFGQHMGKHNLSLVLFYTPWCPHCKKVQPVFEEAAVMLQNCLPPVTMVKINCRQHPALCNGYKIHKYPTFKLLVRGFEVQDYSGPRDKASMVKYMKSYTVDCDNNQDVSVSDEDLKVLLENLLALADRDQTEF